MEVGQHEVGVVEVDVRAAGAQEDARHAADQELGDEGQRPQHRRGQRDRAPVQRGDVDEHHLGDRDRDEQRRDREDVGHARIDAGDELVVRPDREAQHAGAERGVQHGLVGEELLAGEDRDDVGHDADGRQQHHVDLGVPEEPEEVLPEADRGLRDLKFDYNELLLAAIELVHRQPDLVVQDFSFAA